MTRKQADDFCKWVGYIKLVPYMEDNNIKELEDVSLARAIEEAEYQEYVNLNWIDYYDRGTEEYNECTTAIRGAKRFVKKYKGDIQ